ncbi:MAG: murein biosynthesis integral membrane protein MurJ [Candidatus Promineifilaceae bacterium]
MHPNYSRLQSHLMERARHLLRSSVIVIALLGLGKATGLIRLRLISNSFGTTPAYDAFTSANQLPEVFVTLISGGALAAAFIPVYSKYLTDKRSAESLRLANSILTLVLAVLGGISAIAILFASPLSVLLVPGYDSPTQELTADIMRIILLQTTLYGLGGVLSSILNAHQHFTIPALAPITLDIGYLVGLVFFVPTMGVYGLAWGTVIGGGLNILIHIPALRRFGFKAALVLDTKMQGVREIVRLMGPRVVTLGAIQLMDLFIIRLGSFLLAGHTSAYFYGYQIMQLPETLLGTAIAIVVFPTMAELYNAGNISGLKSTSMAALRIIWTLTIPASVGLILLGRPAISVFLQGGAFTETSTDLVFGVLLFFSVRIIAEASLEILARLFYAQHDTKTPMYVALGWLVTNITLAFLLAGPFGVKGLALASTIAFVVQSLALFILNRRRLGNLGDRELMISLGRSLLGAGVMAVIILLIDQLVDNAFLTVAIGGVTGLITYLAVTYLAGGREIPTLIRLARNSSN